MTLEAFAIAVRREYAFGAVNILLALVAIGVGTVLPRFRECQS
jgi:hypothetical protein